MLSSDNNYLDNNSYSHNNKEHIKIEDVEKYTLSDYGLSPESIKANHFGVQITDPRTGEHLPDSFYQSKIESAIAQVEKRLDIVILPRIVTEHHDYYRNDFESHMYVHTFHKPVLQVEKITLEYGRSTIFNYPKHWWRVYNLHGHIQMQPNAMLSGGQGGSLNLAQAYSGYPMIAGVGSIGGSQQGPQMFHVEYVAGMLPPKRSGVTRPHEMHTDLWELIVKITLREVFQQWGRLIIGPGIAGMSMNIDGVSQSIDTTQSAMYGGASAEILQLNEDINGLIAGLKSYYGINLGLI